MTSRDTAAWNPEFKALRDYLQVWSDNGQASRKDRKRELWEAGQSV